MKSLLVAGLIMAVAGSGCAASNALKGGVIGAAGGGLIGAVIGKQAGNTALGAIIGAAVGGTAGALIGANMDRQAEEMRKDLKNAKVERVGEGIKITFESGLLFQTSSAMLNSTSQQNIANLAKILNKYPDTNILVEGHTDSTGTESLNQELSERRAKSVGNQLIGTGVTPARINMMGYGESQPVADNETDMGRQQNRRVEVAIFANEKMKKEAMKGTLN
ncbi:MAG: OmpA family protein [candidate division FCPU426 bacterium]